MVRSFVNKLTLKYPYINGVGLLFAVKLLYLFLGWALSNEHFAEGLTVFTRNDSFWYMKIFDEGYPTVPPKLWVCDAFPFFPLYPIFLKITSLGIFNFDVSAFLLSFILLFLFAKGISKLEYFQNDQSKIISYLIMWVALPFHYFFFVNYTELLFITILFWVLVSIEQQKHLKLSFLLFMLVLCRPTGLIAAFFIWIWKVILVNKDKSFLQRVFSKQSLMFVSAPLGIVMYMIYLHFHCGDAFAFNHSVITWGRTWGNPFRGFMDLRDWNYYVLTGVTVLILVFTGIYTKKLTLGERIFQWSLTIFPLFSGLLVSYYRYFMVVFPIHFVWANAINGSKNRRLMIAILATINLITYGYWVINHGILSY